MANFDDASALFEQTKDPFYLAAFMIQLWLGGLLTRSAAEYAEHKNPKHRSLQRGEAWQSFLQMLGEATRHGHHFLLACLLRFCGSDASPGNLLRRALLPLSLEHRILSPSQPSTTLLSPRSPDWSGNPQLLLRWCDWLDAAVHLQTHRRWHLSPACFDPDPERRELAALGNAQRHLARLSPRARHCWLIDFAAAVTRYQDSPKWAALGKAMADEPARPWLYPEVDTLVISLWPLVKQYNWTYADLLNVIRPALKRPRAYPCGREQDFIAYCSNVLGLRKQTRSRTAKNGQPRGYEIAQQLCPGLARGWVER